MRRGRVRAIAALASTRACVAASVAAGAVSGIAAIDSTAACTTATDDAAVVAASSATYHATAAHATVACTTATNAAVAVATALPAASRTAATAATAACPHPSGTANAAPFLAVNAVGAVVTSVSTAGAKSTWDGGVDGRECWVGQRRLLVEGRRGGCAVHDGVRARLRGLRVWIALDARSG